MKNAEDYLSIKPRLVVTFHTRIYYLLDTIMYIYRDKDPDTNRYT
jgi:hypothetical protein